MNNKKLLSIPIVSLVASFPGYGKENVPFEEIVKPNILIVIADDLGWCDVGFHGSEIRTPNIDKLAKSGICFSQHYAMPTSTPTRVSLMTGKYPSRYGVVSPDYGEVIDLGDPTLASLLAKNGYFTAISGKWHLGSPPYTPLKYGFQSSYGYFHGQIDPYTHEYKTETELAKRESWHRNDRYVVEQGHATDLITAEAIRIINEKREKPFFLYVAYSVPHTPLNEPEEWVSLYDELDIESSRKWFAASVSHMDEGIGKIIDALEKTGKRKNTLVLFLSDNGGAHSWESKTEYRGKYADRPHTVLGNNFPLRGWKGELYEGGIRVPAIANWPEKLQPRVVRIPVHVSDWLPTICDLTGCGRNLNKLRLDGKSIWPLLTGKREIVEERTFYWKTGRDFAVREGDWKLVVHQDSGKAELYDLRSDFRETNDLSKTNSDKVEHMMELLERFKKDDRE